MGRYIRIKGYPKMDNRLRSNQILWRYMSTAKFLNFLQKSELHFARGDKFEDKYEGSFTPSMKTAIKKSFKENDIDSSYEEFKEKLRARVYVSCWHRGPDDSMAMWKIYGESNSAVAITTTVGQLKREIEATHPRFYIRINRVDYVNPWRDPDIDITPYSNVFNYKVKAYQYEREVRAVIDRFDDTFSVEPDKCIKIPINLSSLIRSIVLPPDSSAWFKSTIEESIKDRGISSPLKISMLAGRPI